MNRSRVLVLALAVVLPALSSAQWRWVDRNGRTVFSDQPPGADVPAARIVRQPGTSRASREAPVPAAEASAPAAPPLRTAASAGTPGPKERALLEKKKQADAAEAEKRKAHEAEVARIQRENCTRARQSKASFDSGARIVRTNEKGEREFLDDDQRAAEVRRLQEVIASECKGD